ncbi:MAG: flagellar hook-basal body protein [Balneolaceae bacterium]|jgi:flagellar basal-body rod protein FlgF/flagellar basal-body rod protein FlgG
MIDRLRQQMQALQMFMRAQEVTANNLANINTPGYKADKLFYRAFTDRLNGQSVSSVEPQQTLSMQQGSFESTDNPFDFAIEGNGFFQVESRDGQQLLTRNGRFKLNAEGYLVDKNGARVQGEAGPIRLPQLVKSGALSSDTNIDVAKNGTIIIEGKEVGRLNIVQVDDMQKLQRRGNSYLAVSPDAVVNAGNSSQIMQGYYESGNVNPLTEMVSMTKNMRMFESQQRAMRTTDEMLSQATNRLGKF